MAAVSILLSPELIAEQLGRAAGDVFLGEEVPGTIGNIPTDAISAFTDVVISPSGASGVAAYVEGLGITSTEAIAAFTDIGSRAARFLTEFRTWIAGAFRQAKDRMTAIAQKVIDVARQLGTTIERVLASLYRRLITALIEMSVPSPLRIIGRDNLLSLAPTEVDLTYTLKPSLALPTPDVAGVLKFLSDIAGLELTLAVKLGAS
jgi:hypothetical protein